MLTLRYAAKSDVGMVRSSNEDSGFAGQTLLAVADGMGGHAAGELASSTAIATLAELDSEALETADVLTALDDSIVTAAERIAGFVAAEPNRAGMGTTVTAIAWHDGRIAVIHVGDSRGYLLREGQLSQITKDHTYVQSLIDAGKITEEQARVHPRRSLILRAIDGNQVPERDVSVREALAGDRYLLCSDGLSGVLTDAEIAEILLTVPDPTAAVTALVDKALDGGAPDNVTVVLADVVEATPGAPMMGRPVVVGAAGEQRNRAQLPGLHFPDDVGVDPESTDPDGIPAQPLVVQPGGAAVSTEAGERPAGAAAVAEPGGQVGLITPEPSEANAPEQPRRSLRRHWRLLAGVFLGLAMAAVAVSGFAWWLGSQWFVGQSGGYVTISQGIPQTFLGISLYRTERTTALPVDSLPFYDQERVAGTLDAGTQEEALRIVASLDQHAQECKSVPTPLGCPSSVSAADDESAAEPSPTPTQTGSTLGGSTLGGSSDTAPTSAHAATVGTISGSTAGVRLALRAAP
ncbi:MAG: PP2C family protein-serine/threonine phosphatase [Candidatus Nanopelagicales bacterium]